MYFKDGYVYGNVPEAIIKVTSVKPLSDQIMILKFNTGEERLFDASVLDGPAFEPLKDENIFRHPVLDHGVVTWSNGEIDCSPEYMYSHSYEYSSIA